MSNLHDLLGAAGAPVSIDHAGKTYCLRPITQRVKDEVKQWLRRRALAAAYEDKAFVPPDQYEEMVATISRMASAGHYDFGGKVYLEAMSSPDGLAGVLAILCQCSQDEAMALLVERPAEMQALMAEVVRGSLPRAVVAMMDRKAAEEATGQKQEAGEEAVPTPGG